MKTLASESYNIAWFKLADFVTRGEKERALSVLRLLMHSIADEALTYQLEGDILLAFDDHLAFDRYANAATMFKKIGKMQQAIAIYQHALTFKEDEKIIEALLLTYVVIKQKTGILQTFSKLANLWSLHKKNSDLINLLEKICKLVDPGLQAALYGRYAISLMLHNAHSDQISNLMQTTIHLFKTALANDDTATPDMQKFLAELKAINVKEYKKAESLLKE
jgi:tetratricopeptide (TPR) repeat protein